MKRILLIAFLSLFSSMNVESSAQEPQTAVQLPKGNRLTITVPKYMVDRDKWVYIFGSDQIQWWVIDSLYIEKGQSTFVFENLKIRANTVNINITIEGFSLEWLYEFDNEFDLQFINYENGTEDIIGSGGRSNYMRFKHFNIRRLQYIEHQDKLDQLRKQNVPFDRLTQIDDSLEIVQDICFEQCVLDEINSQYDDAINVNIDILRSYFRYNKHQIDSIMVGIKKRFPNNKWIQAYPHQLKNPQATSQTKQVMQKRRELKNGRHSEIERPKVEPYKIGDVVSGLAIKDKDGKLISLDSIKTKFVLIDFWAHWCVPCRKESPYLIQAQNEFSDQFTVLAVSVDKNAQKWLNTIRDDHTEMLTHVLLGEGTAEANLVLAKFDVKSLPKNFLLDDQRKIIAIDLRGDELLDVIREFCK